MKETNSTFNFLDLQKETQEHILDTIAGEFMIDYGYYTDEGLSVSLTEIDHLAHEFCKSRKWMLRDDFDWTWVGESDNLGICDFCKTKAILTPYHDIAEHGLYGSTVINANLCSECIY